MENNLTVEVHIAKLKPGVKDAHFLEAADAIMADARSMEGFIRREVLKGADGEWVDIIYWRSMADAQRAAEAFAEIPAGQKFVELVDLETLTLLFSEQVRSYQ